jgi:hypothetical protein
VEYLLEEPRLAEPAGQHALDGSGDN